MWSRRNTVVNDILNNRYDQHDGWDGRPKVRITVMITAEKPEGLKVMDRPSAIRALNALLPMNEKGERFGAQIVQSASVSSRLSTLTFLSPTDSASSTSSLIATRSVVRAGKISATSAPANLANTTILVITFWSCIFSYQEPALDRILAVHDRRVPHTKLKMFTLHTKYDTDPLGVHPYVFALRLPTRARQSGYKASNCNTTIGITSG